MVNVELLEKTMQYIEDHPEQHKQDEWVTECGTSACVAGWACRLSELTRAYDYSSGEVVRYRGDVVHVREAATDLLGLSQRDAAILFFGGNTREELKLMVKDLANGEHLTPAPTAVQKVLDCGYEPEAYFSREW